MINQKFFSGGSIRTGLGLGLIRRHRNLVILAENATWNSKYSKIMRILWCLIYALAVGLVLLILLPQFARAGGPRYVAGVSYFDPGTTGTPITWAQGAITYYTDQGNLSSILPGSSADALVANAFSQWTSIPTAAVSATRAGQLAEDVSGANVIVNGDGSITMPADIMPSAAGTPVGIVYDADGTVTSALLGQGAGNAANCFTDAVFGGVDNFATSAQFQHALVILNGNCAQSSSQVPEVEYRLVRVLGRILGLDWSQVNLNVQTGNPTPGQADYAGFSIMHAMDSVRCVPISTCYPNPYQPKMDDQAALSRLYPITADNISNFPGKQLFFATTARIHGSVRFVDASGQSAQGMQGVNVVARWIDPSTGSPSRTYVSASVSGFLYCGNAGNIITGFNDPSGQPFNRFGSNDSAVEGSFDLAGLQIPNGANSAQYQLTVEPLDPIWSEAVGPYGPWQVQPSGSADPITVTVTLGGDIQQDILMQKSASKPPSWFEPTTYAAPASLPTGGDWTASLNSYGNPDYFWFNAQANRTLSAIVTALDDYGVLSQSKAQPVIGMWSLSNPGQSPAPAETPSSFNTLFFGETRLDAQFQQTTSFRLAISDYRGDARPDYRYHARIFYGDSVIPARAGVAGGTPLALRGLGFQPNTIIKLGSANTPQIALSANQMLVNAPPMPDGVQDIGLSDTPTGAASTMTGVLTYGAGPGDNIRLLLGTNPATPVGGQAPNPIRLQVVAPDGITPVAGASVFLTSTPALAFSACSGGASCTVLTDQSGLVSSQLTVLSAGVMTITAKLAPASYPSPKQVQTTLLGTSSLLDLSLASPLAWIAQGATVGISLIARALNNGVPINGATIGYKVVKGSGILSASSATTNAGGYAASTLQISAMSGDVQVSVCAEPGNAPCQSFYGTSVPASALQMQAVSGLAQELLVGQNFAPVMIRVTDSSTPPNPVLGAGVVFQVMVGRLPSNQPIIFVGQTGNTRPEIPVILSSSQATIQSDGNGLASYSTFSGGNSGANSYPGNSRSRKQHNTVCAAVVAGKMIFTELTFSL